MALAELDAHIIALSDSMDADFWLDPARLRQDPEWDRIRELARDVLAAFDWRDEVPPRNGAIYVSKDGFAKNE